MQHQRHAAHAVTLLAAALLAPFAAFGQDNRGSARIEWQHDGANVAEWRLYGGRTPSTLGQMAVVLDRTARIGTIDGLATGEWFFQVTAVGLSAAESGPSQTIRCLVPTSGLNQCSIPLSPPGPVRNVVIVPIAASTAPRYLRLTFTKRRGAANSLQLDELQLLSAGQPVTIAGAIVSNPGGASPTYELPGQLVGTSNGKWLDFNFSTQISSVTGRSVVVVDLVTPRTFNGYRLRTANDAPERDPVSWALEVSADGVTYRSIDARTDFATPTARGAFTSTFTVTP